MTLDAMRYQSHLRHIRGCLLESNQLEQCSKPLTTSSYGKNEELKKGRDKRMEEKRKEKGWGRGGKGKGKEKKREGNRLE
jgi:hypothetical protein